MPVLRYGTNSSVQLEFAKGVVLGESGTPRGQPLSDPTAALTAMLRAPLDYPPLARCTTPVDRIVLALDRGLPQVAQLTVAIIDALVEAGIAPDGITILQSQAAGNAQADDPLRNAASSFQERITLLTHDPDDRRQLAYLAASEAGEAILINRALHEADVVLPVGCVRSDKSAGYFGIHGGIFPTFSDAKTIQRFRGFASLNGQGNRRRELTAEVDHVAWLLGVSFTIQIVPAAGDQVLHVLAGESDAVRRRARELYHAAWSWPVARQVSLVVAAIEGGADQQTWENVGRALAGGGTLRRGRRLDRAVLRPGHAARPGHATDCRSLVARGGSAAGGQAAARRRPAGRTTRSGSAAREGLFVEPLGGGRGGGVGHDPHRRPGRIGTPCPPALVVHPSGQRPARDSR